MSSSHRTSRMIASSTSPANSPHHQSVCDSFGIPLGKYYPSNYKYLANTTVVPVPDQSRPLSSMNLDTGLWTRRRTTKKKGWLKPHEQKAAEWSMKLQQYQREMMTEVRNAVKERNLNIWRLPESVVLHPTETDYDAITPFELGGTEANGYINEGERRRSERANSGTKSESKNLNDIKERLIKVISTT